MRKGLGKAVAVCLAAALPGTASAFSAQDVLTYCQATHADPGFVANKLRAEGWEEVDPARSPATLTTLSLALMATWNFQTRESYNPSDWQADWVIAQENAGLYLAKRYGKTTTLLTHPKTGSLVMVSWTDGPAIRMHCVLAVTEAATKSQSYHPRLQRPDAGFAFYAIVEGSDRMTSRILGGASSVSLARPIVEQELGIATDVVAVFDTWMTYPASAVRP